METNRIGHLITWQWSLYPQSHRDRANLVVHVLMVPLFMAGTLALPLALVISPWLLPCGIVSMAAALGLQGQGHRREQNHPAPFRGPWDVLARIFVEQWITFPRFVLTGELVRVWRSHDRTPATDL